MRPFEGFGYTCHPPENASQEPRFPRRHSPTVGLSALGARAFASAFHRGLEPRLRAAAGRRERSPRCPVSLQVQALRWRRPRRSPAPWAGSQEPEGIDPSRRPALTCRFPLTGWLLTPSCSPFPLSLSARPSSRLPGAGRRPRRSRITRPPALQLPCGVARQVPAAARLGAEVERGGGEQTGLGGRRV